MPTLHVEVLRKSCEYGYKLDPAVPHRLDWLITDIAQQRVYRLKHFIGSTEKFLDEKPVLEASCNGCRVTPC